MAELALPIVDDAVNEHPFGRFQLVGSLVKTFGFQRTEGGFIAFPLWEHGGLVRELINRGIPSAYR